MGDVWFTSDWHIGHSKVAEHRGFDTPLDHDFAIVDSVTDHLAPGDQLWNLGDLTAGSKARETWALDLIGDDLSAYEHHLIAGNHDSVHPGVNRDSHKRLGAFGEVFESVQLFARRKIAGQYVMLSHFPYVGDHTTEERMRDYRLRDCGRWLLHGHTHSTERMSAAEHRIVNGMGQVVSVIRPDKQLHVGWDAWRRPVHLDEIAEMIREGS